MSEAKSYVLIGMSDEDNSIQFKVVHLTMDREGDKEYAHQMSEMRKRMSRCTAAPAFMLVPLKQFEASLAELEGVSFPVSKPAEPAAAKSPGKPVTKLPCEMTSTVNVENVIRYRINLQRNMAGEWLTCVENLIDDGFGNYKSHTIPDCRFVHFWCSDYARALQDFMERCKRHDVEPIIQYAEQET